MFGVQHDRKDRLEETDKNGKVAIKKRRRWTYRVRQLNSGKIEQFF